MKNPAPRMREPGVSLGGFNLNRPYSVFGSLPQASYKTDLTVEPGARRQSFAADLVRIEFGKWYCPPHAREFVDRRPNEPPRRPWEWRR